MCEYGTLRGLIKHYVKTLQLRQEAPYPTLRLEAAEDIQRYRRSQQKVRLHDARLDRDDGDWDTSDTDSTTRMGA
jgi:hypothetical protein